MAQSPHSWNPEEGLVLEERVWRGKMEPTSVTYQSFPTTPSLTTGVSHGILTRLGDREANSEGTHSHALRKLQGSGGGERP